MKIPEKMPNGLTVMTEEQVEEFFREYPGGVLIGQFYTDGLPEDFVNLKLKAYKEYRNMTDVKDDVGFYDYVFLGVLLFNPHYHLSDFVFDVASADLEDLVYMAKDFTACDWLTDYVNMIIDLNKATKEQYKQQLTDILRDRVLKSVGVYTMT